MPMFIDFYAPPQRSLASSPIPNGVVGMMAFIATELMFFAALLSAYYVTRAGAIEWPPWDQPRLPVMTTAFNTCVLILSGMLLFQSHQWLREETIETAKKWLLASMGLGLFFVMFQGYEWGRLIQYGLTMTSSSYGSLFYLIIGAHALHALCAILALFYAYSRLTRIALPDAKTEFVVAQMFWYFVVGIWPVLYLCVYLS